MSQLSGRIFSFRRLHADLSKHGRGACWEFISGEEVTRSFQSSVQRSSETSNRDQ